MTQRRNTRRMNRLRTAFYQTGRDQDAQHNPDANCWLCGQPIDYTVTPGTTPDSHELDHYHPVSTHPHLQEDPANFRHAHKACNANRGNRTPTAGIGAPLTWW